MRHESRGPVPHNLKGTPGPTKCQASHLSPTCQASHLSQFPVSSSVDPARIPFARLLLRSPSPLVATRTPAAAVAVTASPHNHKASRTPPAMDFSTASSSSPHGAAARVARC